MPRVEDLFTALCGGQRFTKIDLKQAYTQIMLEEDCKKYTTINTLLGLFQYTRLPFEVSTAPAIFQRVIEGMLVGIPNILVQVDDILATGLDDESHLRNLENVLNHLERAGLKANTKKCHFFEPPVVYMCHAVDQEGTHPTEEKIEAIRKAPEPRDKGQLLLK